MTSALRHGSSLRTRLVAAFLLVAAISAATTSALTYREARTAVLTQSQDTAVATLRQFMELAYVPLPPGQADLDGLVAGLARQSTPHPWQVVAEYGPVRASSGPVPSPGGTGGNGGGGAADRAALVGDDVRRAVGTGRTAVVRRVVEAGVPYLVAAVPYTVDAGGTPTPSGLVVYVVMALGEEQQTVDAVVVAARNGGLLGLGIALVPAVLATRGVLRPVRSLRAAAQRMGSGRLDTRIEVRGHDELAQLGATFNATASALERSVADLRLAEERARRFAADVSHELRTPLAGMLAITDVLADGEARVDADTARALRLTRIETSRLATLVEDLIEISRFDAGAAELNLSDVDVAECLQKTVELRHWQREVDVRASRGLRASLDPRRIDVVVANLLGNALVHGARPVTLSARSEAVDDDEDLVVEVRDSGPGIDPSVLPHVFDRFYKGDHGRSRSRGSGLGLATALENARLHGGTLEAANLPQGGAVLTLRVPLRAST